MKELIERMNEVLSAWKKTFGVTSQMELKFDVNADEVVCLNDHIIFMPDNLSLSSVDFNAESVKFYFEETRKVLAVGIVWIEDEGPKANTIRFGYESEM